MGIRIIDGDLFDTKARYICHQVNCQGKMGSGVAKVVREKFPKAYSEYNKLCSGTTDKTELLGHVQIVRCRAWEHEVFICNLFGQLNYGYDGKRFTDYAALRNCMRSLRDLVPENETIAMPYKIGCGLGGADWLEISAMITEELGCSHDVELWRLDSNAERR